MNSNEKDEQILTVEVEIEQYYQLQEQIKQLEQEQKSCFSLTDLALVALGISFFN